MYFTIIFNNTVSASLEYNKIIDYMKKQNISAVTKFFVKRWLFPTLRKMTLYLTSHKILLVTPSLYWIQIFLFDFFQILAGNTTS